MAAKIKRFASTTDHVTDDVNRAISRLDARDISVQFVTTVVPVEPKRGMGSTETKVLYEAYVTYVGTERF